MTRQMPYEPLPASVLFALCASWLVFIRVQRDVYEWLNRRRDGSTIGVRVWGWETVQSR
jgi:hypothetical protein